MKLNDPPPPQLQGTGLDIQPIGGPHPQQWIGHPTHGGPPPPKSQHSGLNIQPMGDPTPTIVDWDLDCLALSDKGDKHAGHHKSCSS